ncbi:tumor necrosis factor b (TNF superfamily, member 2) [Thunnus thynnus]|uniref:Lymphotoxin-alpha n=2 Tax=Thunnus TaxID=8234 RepID=B5U9A9_THUOR|nr:tumor necrosis factor b (TNF superfamily, member 2) [Thunnus maccoyii]AGQ48131.1 tumor necrosis factor 1 [Thunnus thynnus]BAG72141.1 tumor necrosis factor 1 [Thunnus orientalis]|eukprot:superscaffoldBa00000743_g6929
MVAYTTAPADVETGLEERTVVLVEKKSSTGWIWKVSGTLLIILLCLGGILLFSWYWNGRPELMQSGKTEALMSHTADKKGPHHELRRNSTNAAIHLEGICDDCGKDKLEWRVDQGQAFAQGGLKLLDNQIVIPQSGLYFVYSQASFRVTCSDGDEQGAGKRLTPLSHRIWRYSDSVGSKASLMSAVRSACQQGAQEGSYRVGQGWYNAIYLGAVFQLNAGDKLWTETNQQSELEIDDGKTFFGVFAL